VYLPYCSRANTDEFLAYLGKLRQLWEELQCPNICFVGDVNAGVTNTFGGVLEDFCMENDFIISDYALLPQDTFTYISDAHSTTSWIDHFVSSFSVHQAMFHMEALTECIISDHRAVAVSIQCSHLPEFDEEVMEPQPSRIDWLKVTAQEREVYYHASKNLLDQRNWPQTLGTVKTLIVQMRNIWKKLKICMQSWPVLCLLLHPLQLKQQGKRMKVNLTFLAGTRWSNQNTKLQRQLSGYG